MSSARRPAGPPQRSWREQQAPPLDPVVSRRIRRGMWSLFSVGLMAAFVWLVIWFFGPRPVTHVFAVAVTEYDVVDAPPLPFAPQALENWQKVETLDVHLAPSVLSAGRLKEWLASFNGRGGPAPVPLRKQDALIVYLAAHGVSRSDGEHGATAWLVGSEFHPPRGPAGKVDLVSVDDVLEAVRQSNAERKLVVLDAGCVERDVALGMLVNEFPSLLKEKVKQYDGVWLLVSHDLFEKSHGAYRDRQNVFAHFVTRGLAGEADDPKHPDGVDLSELYRFVRNGVAGYVFQASGGRETQTPQLLGPGDDQDELLRKSRAVALTTWAKLPKKPETNLKEQEEKTNESKPAGDAPSSEKSAFKAPLPRMSPLALMLAPQDTATTSNASEPQEPGDAKSNDSAVPPQAAADAKKNGGQASDEARSGSDEKKSGDDNKKTEPTEAGPSNQAPQGKPSSQAAPEKPDQEAPFPRELRKQWQTCRDLSDRAAHAWVPVDYAPHRWLRWVEKLKGYEMRWLRGGASDPGQMIHDAELELAYLRDAEKFQAELSPALAAADRSGRLASVLQLRDDLVFRLRYYIDSPLELGKTDIESLIDRLDELFELLGSTAAAKEQPLAAEAWIERVEETCAGLRTPMNNLDRQLDEFLRRDDWTTMEALLAFPWIAVERRMELLAKLGQLLPLADTLRENELPARTSGWKRTQQYAQLQARWQRLVERSPERELTLEMARRLTADATDLEGIRKIAARFASLRGKLIATLEDRNLRSGQAANQLRLLDARIEVSDERRIMETDRVPDQQLPSQIRLVPLAQNGGRVIAAGDKLELRWQIESTSGRRQSGVVWELANDHPDSVRVDATRGSVVWKGASPLPIVVQVSTVERASCDARLTLRLSAPGGSQEDSVELRVRPLELVELQVAVEGPQLAGMHEIVSRDPTKRVNQWILRPLATGQTTFRLGLRNPSRQKRKLDYRLLVVTENGLTPRGQDESIAQWLGKDGPPLGVKLLQDKTSLELEPNSEKPLSIVAPVKPAAAPAPPAAEKTKPPEGQPIEALVCEMNDPAFGPLSRYFWIEIEPLEPSHYLLPQVQLGEDGRISMELEPFDKDRLPEEGSKIRWHWPEGSVWKSAEEVLTLERPLRATIGLIKDIRQSPLELLIDADGYPRAFRYSITQPGRQLPKAQAQRELRLVDPLAGERRWLQRGRPVQIKLASEFPQRGGANVVRLELRDETGEQQEVREYRADRLIDFRLLPAQDAGAFTIATQVRDIDAEFQTSRYQDQELRLVATLGSLQESCFFRIDSRTPTVKPDGRPHVFEGEKLRVRLRAIDQGGEVEKVEVALDPESTGKWEGLKPKSATFDPEDDVWVVDLPTNDKEVFRARESSRFLARATDKAANTSEPQTFSFDIVPPPPKPSGPAAANTRGNLRIKVTYAGAPATLLAVTVTGPKNWQGKTDQGGYFILKDFPAGTYKFRFQGFGRAGTPVESEHEFNFQPTDKRLNEEEFETHKRS